MMCLKGEFIEQHFAFKARCSTIMPIKKSFFGTAFHTFSDFFFPWSRRNGVLPCGILNVGNSRKSLDAKSGEQAGWEQYYLKSCERGKWNRKANEPKGLKRYNFDPYLIVTPTPFRNILGIYFIQPSIKAY